MIFNLFLSFQFTRKLKKPPVQITVTISNWGFKFLLNYGSYWFARICD